MGDPISNSVKKATKDSSILGTGFKLLTKMNTPASVGEKAETITSSTINAVKSNPYHQKFSAETEDEQEKAKDRHWTKSLPVATGALLLGAAVPKIIKTGDVAAPLKDVRDGFKRVPAAILNKASKKHKVVKHAAAGAEKAVKAAGGKAKVNNSPLANYGAGLFKGVGALTPFLIGSAYLDHKAKKAKNEEKEKRELLSESYGRVKPVANVARKFSKGYYRKSAGEENFLYEKTALSNETIERYRQARIKQFKDRARENINRDRKIAMRHINDMKRMYPDGGDVVDKHIKGVMTDLKMNKYNELNKKEEAIKRVNRKVKEHLEDKYQRDINAAKRKADKTLGGKISYRVKHPFGTLHPLTEGKIFLDKNKKKILGATGILTAGALVNTVHKKFVKPKLKDKVKDSVKSHYDKKVDAVYQNARNEKQTEKQASFMEMFDPKAAVGRVILNAAEMPLDLAWTAGSEIIKGRERVKKAQNKVSSPSFRNNFSSKGMNRNDRRHNVNHTSSRFRTKNS